MCRAEGAEMKITVELPCETVTCSASPVNGGECGIVTATFYTTVLSQNISIKWFALYIWIPLFTFDTTGVKFRFRFFSLHLL